MLEPAKNHANGSLKILFNIKRKERERKRRKRRKKKEITGT